MLMNCLVDCIVCLLKSATIEKLLVLYSYSVDTSSDLDSVKKCPLDQCLSSSPLAGHGSSVVSMFVLLASGP